MVAQHIISLKNNKTFFCIDKTFRQVDFSYTKNSGEEVKVKTLEETEYPDFYYNKAQDVEENETSNVM